MEQNIPFDMLCYFFLLYSLGYFVFYGSFSYMLILTGYISSESYYLGIHFVVVFRFWSTLCYSNIPYPSLFTFKTHIIVYSKLMAVYMNI